MIETAEQQALFPTPERIRKLTSKVEEQFKAAMSAIGQAGEAGDFFRLFSRYADKLDKAKNDRADDLIVTNIRYAIGQAQKLVGQLQGAEASLLQAKEDIAEIERLEEYQRTHEPPAPEEPTTGGEVLLAAIAEAAAKEESAGAAEDADDYDEDLDTEELDEDDLDEADVDTDA